MPTDNPPTSTGTPPPLGRRVWLAIAGMGITQIIGWGTTYYLLTILGPQIATSLDLSPPVTTSGLSILMLLGAVLGPYSGRMMDIHGARPVMAFGSVVASAGLVALSFAAGPVSYILAWIILGSSASMILYPAAFTALTQAAPASARRAITLLTLAGGLASTVFWPTSGYLLTLTDWRHVCLIYAGFNLLVCMPLHLLTIPGRAERSEAQDSHAAAPQGLPESARPRAVVLLATMLALNSMLVTAVLNQFLVSLTVLGQSVENTLLFGMVFGFAQVSSRLADMLFGARYNPLNAGIAVTLGYALALVFLVVGAGTSPAAGFAFAILFGACNGILTIVRGTLVLALFGTKGYGERLGTITVAQGMAGAAAPVILSMVLSHFGAEVALAYCIAIALMALVAMTALFRHATRSIVPARTD